MKVFLRGLFLSVLLFFTFSQNAMAYDPDAHFQITRMVYRMSGMKPEVADFYAMRNLWTDESFATSPMGVFPVLWQAMKRYLYHFPGDAQHVPGGSYGNGGFSLLSTARRDSPISREPGYIGLRDGDPEKTGLSGHAEQDSRGHEKYSPEAGHGYDGHAPDEPAQDPEKYEEMIRTTFRKAHRIMQTLDESGKDRNIHLLDLPPSVDVPYEKLADKFISQKLLHDTIRNDFRTDPRFVGPAVHVILEQAQENGYIQPDVDIKQFEPTKDELAKRVQTREVIRGIIEKLMEKGDKVVNREQVLQTLLPDVERDFLTNADLTPAMLEDRKKLLVDTILNRMTDHLIRPAIGTEVKFLAEDDQRGDAKLSLRDLELAIRFEDFNNVARTFVGEAPNFRIDHSHKINNPKEFPEVESLNPELKAKIPAYDVRMPKWDKVKWNAKFTKNTLDYYFRALKVAGDPKYGGAGSAVLRNGIWFLNLFNPVKNYGLAPEADGSIRLTMTDPRNISMIDDERFQELLDDGHFKPQMNPKMVAKLGKDRLKFIEETAQRAEQKGKPEEAEALRALAKACALGKTKVAAK